MQIIINTIQPDKTNNLLWIQEKTTLKFPSTSFPYIQIT